LYLYASLSHFLLFVLEIPYWTDDKEETWKKLIDDKIKEVRLIIERSS